MSAAVAVAVGVSSKKRKADVVKSENEGSEKKLRAEQSCVCVGSRPRGWDWSKRDGFENLDVTSGSQTGKAVSPFYLKIELAYIAMRWFLRGEIKDEKLWNIAPKRTAPFEHVWQGPKVFKELGHWDEEKQKPTEKYWTDRAVIFFDKGKDSTKPDKGNRRPKIVKALIEKHEKTCADCQNIKKQRAANKVAAKKIKSQGKKRVYTPLPVCPNLPKPIGHWYAGKLRGLVESRLTIYWPYYTHAIQDVPFFKNTKKGLPDLRKLMVIDVDGPSVFKYPEGREVTAELLDEVAYCREAPMGHGYVFAAALLELKRPAYKDETKIKVEVKEETAEKKEWVFHLMSLNGDDDYGALSIENEVGTDVAYRECLKNGGSADFGDSDNWHASIQEYRFSTEKDRGAAMEAVGCALSEIDYDGSKHSNAVIMTPGEEAADDPEKNEGSDEEGEEGEEEGDDDHDYDGDASE